MNEEHVLKASLEHLKNELEESGVLKEMNPIHASPEYRIQLAVNLFYKFILACNLSEPIKNEYKSAVDSLLDCRSLSSSKQTYETIEKHFPLTQPVPKINAYAQTSGETKYVDDLSKLSLQLSGSFILSKVAKGKIDSINTDKGKH